MLSIIEKIILQKQSIIYVLFDRKFQIIIASENVNKFTDCANSIKVGDDVRDYFPEIFGIEKECLTLIDNPQNGFDIEGICRENKQEGIVYFNLHIGVIVDDSNRGLILIIQDVTREFILKQKYVQSANDSYLLINRIMATNAYINELINSMADSLFVTTFSGIIKQVNHAAEKLFGHEEKQLIGQPISLIIPDVNLLEKIRIKSDDLNEKYHWENKSEKYLEVNCRTKTGKEIVVAFSCSMFSTEITELQNYIYIGRDITEHKRMEAQLQKANENLTESVHQLQHRNQDITRLSQLSYQLQGCFTLAEAERAIAEMVPPIFPNSIGGIITKLNLFDRQLDCQSELRILTSWGEGSGCNQKNVSTADCPAWTSGQRYFICDLQLCSVRENISPEISRGSSCCIPMILQGQTIGLLYLSWPEVPEINQEKQDLAMTVAEHIGLALVNLTVRETLKNQSIRDPLTGLFNRRYLQDSVEQEIQRATKKQQSIGMIMLDVDYFKKFNDTFGHQAGDKVLQAIAQLLMRSIRSMDLPCRYGGEEFLVILVGANLAVTQARAETLRSGVKLLRLEHQGESLGSISCSFGVACFPGHGQTLGELVAAADAALYEAKKLGRDRVVAPELMTATNPELNH
jgi:diguanylate cyclase (GGDEF)-like protein/PAS domain S-box-containing protein